jgi:hypothetical protein
VTPRPGAAPGDYSLLVGAYAAEPLPDAEGNPRTPIGTLAVTAASFPPVTKHTVFRTVIGDDGRRLVGYDWDGTLPYRLRLYLHWQTPQGYVTEVRDDVTLVTEGLSLPPYRGLWGIPLTNWRLDWETYALFSDSLAGHYVPFAQGIVWTGENLPTPVGEPGESLMLDEHFRSNRPLTSDLVISVRMMGLEPDGFHWAWDDLHDSIPALGGDSHTKVDRRFGRSFTPPRDGG